MKTLPRHLLLAAVVLTVCCAERQALSAAPELQKSRTAQSGERGPQVLSFEQLQVRRKARHQQVRPVLQDRQWVPQQAFIRPVVTAEPVCPVVHEIYPPSRFRLPPPAILA